MGVYESKVMDWEIQRACATGIVNVILGMFKGQSITPQQFLALPFDEVDPLDPVEQAQAILTDEQIWEAWQKQINGEHTNRDN